MHSSIQSSIEPVRSRPKISKPARESKPEWLSLKEASEFLGVHFATLRSWADDGEMRAYRTPGGHRRFHLADLRHFLEQHALQPVDYTEAGLVKAAVDRTRLELQKVEHTPVQWHYALEEAAHDQRRERGRQLFALAIAFMLKPTQRPRLLEEGHKLGWEYGYEARIHKVGLVAAGRAVQFFRNQLVQAIRNEEQPELTDASDPQIHRLLDQFLDEVLYAVLDGYEQNPAG